jgi:antitoxin YefM
MQVTSYSEFRKNMAAMIDRVNADHVPMIITRAGKPPAVLMSLEDFSSYEETDFLLRNPENRKRLLESIAAADRGEYVVRDLIED